MEMNKITKEIMTECLKDKRAWDKKTGELKLSWIQSAYMHWRENRWFVEIYFPTMFTEVTKMKESNKYPEDVFVWFEYEEGCAGWWLDDDNLHYELEQDMENGELGQSYYGDVWGYQESTHDEIMALAEKLDVVPEIYKQISMF